MTQGLNEEKNSALLHLKDVKVKYQRVLFELETRRMEDSGVWQEKNEISVLLQTHCILASPVSDFQ